MLLRMRLVQQSNHGDTESTETNVIILVPLAGGYSKLFFSVSSVPPWLTEFALPHVPYRTDDCIAFNAASAL